MENIGVRAAKEIYSRIDSEHSLTDILNEIDVQRASLCYWAHKNRIPGGQSLRKMDLAGYDIHYILTGERK